MSTPLALAFLPQHAPNELEVIASAGSRELFRANFRCRTGQALHPSPDALFCLGLYPASEIGAPLKLAGEVEASLLGRAKSISDLFRTWWVGCRNVDVDARPRQAQPSAVQRGAALFFSGGVDSCYSLVDAQQRLSALITLVGVDVPLSDTEATARLEAMSRDVAERKGLESIVIETNVAQVFHPYVSWIEHHGSALAAIGHMLSRRIDRILIASSGNEATWNSPWGSHPALDPLLGSAQLAVEHHGLVSRFDKIAAIARDPDLLNILRVCNRSRHNCGQCDKCAFAMRALEILGFDSAPTFPSFLPRRGQMKAVDHAFFTELERLHEAAMEAGRGDLAPEIEEAMARYQKREPLRKLGFGRLRSWLRVRRHRYRWQRACA